MIEININLMSKRYGKKMVVQGFTARVRPGITALLGPNGAGKSTLFGLVAGLYRPSEGSVRVNGLDPYVLHRKVAGGMGVLPSRDGLLDRTGARQQLELFARLYGLNARTATERCALMLSELGLTASAGAHVGTFSTGMRKRLAIARAMLHQPEIVLLDEPTSGLDPDQAARLRNLMLSWRDEGRLIFFNTHSLSEVARVADTVMVMAGGRLLFSGSIADFLLHAPASGETAERMEQAYLSLLRQAYASSATR